MTSRSTALIVGIVGGSVLALFALGYGAGSLTDPDGVGIGGAGAWLTANLGGSTWLFLAVLAAYGVHLGRLHDLLEAEPSLREVAQLDQLIDVWIHLFIGIGVVWTAIGMRSALQAALGDTHAAMNDTAGDVLERLVDGGILLALSTTIVGAVGGYLMRLGKSLYLGAALQAFYEEVNHAELRALLASVQRLEARLTYGASWGQTNPPAAATTVAAAPVPMEERP